MNHEIRLKTLIFSESNKKREFILHDLHKITPHYMREENIAMPDGTRKYEP